MSSHLNYRADVDGLRAIAVTSVVVYHADASALPGGFTGVDIFFVISGYLITLILTGDAERGSFSISRFYERRIRRIFPALLFMILCVLVMGHLLLLPGDFRELARSAFWAMSFLANIFFWQNTGYFDPARETMPLLHTWSLGVEEQFYLLWPLLILGIAGFGARKRQGAVLLLLLISFVSCIGLSTSNPQASFFLPLTRAWEFAFGALLALSLPGFGSLSDSRVLREAAGWLGLLLLSAGFVFVSSSQTFPSFNALLPVVGTALLIGVGGIGANSISTALSVAPIVFVGKISYSLYLWHWPVFVFFRHYNSGMAPSALEALLLIAISGLLAWFSWRVVEQPLRKTSATRRTVFSSGAAAVGLVLCASVVIDGFGGFPQRIPDEARRLADHRAMWTWECPFKRSFEGISLRRCVLGAPWSESTRRALLWGDSHALHYAPLVDRVAREQGLSVLLFDSCAPFLDARQVFRQRDDQPAYSESCGQEREEILGYVEADESIELVILASAWSLYPARIHGGDGVVSQEAGLHLMRSAVRKTLLELDPGRRDLLVLAEVPRPNRDMTSCAVQEVGGVLRRPCGFDHRKLDRSDIERIHGGTNRVLREATSGLPRTRLVNSTDALCNPAGCETYLNGEFIYRDSNHLRRNLKPATLDLLIHKLDLAAAMRLDAGASSRSSVGGR